MESERRGHHLARGSSGSARRTRQQRQRPQDEAAAAAPSGRPRDPKPSEFECVRGVSISNVQPRGCPPGRSRGNFSEIFLNPCVSFITYSYATDAAAIPCPPHRRQGSRQSQDSPVMTGGIGQYFARIGLTPRADSVLTECESEHPHDWANQLDNREWIQRALSVEHGRV